jgi:hypothetical protein
MPGPTTLFLQAPGLSQPATGQGQLAFFFWVLALDLFFWVLVVLLLVLGTLAVSKLGAIIALRGEGMQPRHVQLEGRSSSRQGLSLWCFGSGASTPPSVTVFAYQFILAGCRITPVSVSWT